MNWASSHRCTEWGEIIECGMWPGAFADLMLLTERFDSPFFLAGASSDICHHVVSCLPYKCMHARALRTHKPHAGVTAAYRKMKHVA